MAIRFYKEQGSVKADIRRAIITIMPGGNSVVIDGLLNSYELEQILTKMKELQVEKQAYEDNLPDDYEVN